MSRARPASLLAPLLAVMLLLAVPAPAVARAMLWYDDGWGKPVYFPSEPAATPPATLAPAASPEIAPAPSEPPARDWIAVAEGLWALLAILWVGSCLIAAAALTPPRPPPRPARRAASRRNRLRLVAAQRDAPPPAEASPAALPTRLLRRQQSPSAD